MTSFRQIEANRRNARLSTGPVTEEGKRRSRKNALRHGLTAETVIDALEDAQDYAGFEMAVTADYDAQSVVERELVLRLASLLWRLRRATAIESGLFKIQALQLLQFRHRRGAHSAHQEIVDVMYRDVGTTEEEQHDDVEPIHDADRSSSSNLETSFDNLTRSYIRLTNLQNCPLDRLSRYESTLWRQVRQTLFALQSLTRNKPGERTRLRRSPPW
jgi:hypothetical protein